MDNIYVTNNNTMYKITLESRGIKTEFLQITLNT